MLRLTLAALLAAFALGQEERMVVGVISEASPGRMVVVLDRDGYPGQKRGMSLTFTVISTTRVLDNERPAVQGAIAPRRQAVVKYVHGNAGALVAREIRLLGTVPDGLIRSGRPESTLRLTDVRIQRTPRQGEAGIEHVKAGTDFHIAFYLQVDAKGPLEVEYRCMNPDFSRASKSGKEALKSLRVCDYTETVPAGFKGVRYRAFTMRYPRGSNGSDVIVAEVAPVIRSAGGVTKAYQRKLAPVMILP